MVYVNGMQEISRQYYKIEESEDNDYLLLVNHIYVVEICSVMSSHLYLKIGECSYMQAILIPHPRKKSVWEYSNDGITNYVGHPENAGV